MKIFIVSNLVSILMLFSTLDNYDLKIELCKSNNELVLFNITSYIENEKVTILNINTLVEEKVILHNNSLTSYYFYNKDFINNQLSFSIITKDLIYPFEIYYQSDVNLFNKDHNVIYYTHYFVSSNKNVLIKNIEEYVIWDNKMDYLINNNYIDINQIFNLFTYGSFDFDKIFLIVHQATLFNNLKYSLFHHGYVFDVNYKQFNNRLNLYLDYYFYDIKTFQMRTNEVENSKIINQIIIPKSFINKSINMSLVILKEGKASFLFTSVYINSIKNNGELK